MTTIAHKQHYSVTYKISSLQIQLKTCDDDVRLIPKNVTVWIITNEVVVLLK
jgi:hypothetical protein